MNRAIVIVSMLALGALAQEGPRLGKEAEAELKAWMELGKTGPEHAQLQKAVGSWTVEGRIWMEKGKDPLTTSGKATFTSVFDGRYVRQEYECSMGGMPYGGIGYAGFDNATGKHQQVWLESNGTGILVFTGTETVPGKEWTYTGTRMGPGGKPCKQRLVVKQVGDDRQVVEGYADDGKGEMQCVELVYTRSK
jgi:hypothetical protein